MTEFGTVTAQFVPTVPLVVRGPSGVERQVTAVIDTGFGGELSLPADLVSVFGLGQSYGTNYRMADGRVRYFTVYAAQVLWFGEWLDIQLVSLGSEVLLGMGLLAGRGLWVEAHPGGVVEVRPLGTNGG